MKNVFYILFLVVGFISCRKDQIISTAEITPYEIQYPEVIAARIPPMEIPADNPMTVQGVVLGKKLFYEKLLSADNTQACATCHLSENSFTDPLKFSVGIDDIEGTRNAMPIFNLGWAPSLFWDGRSKTLEEQALDPVTNPIEMHNTWEAAVAALQATTDYPLLFKAAFGTEIIDSLLVAKALAQFERTLISGNSPYDKYLRGEPTGYSPGDDFKMKAGYGIFIEESKGDCFHCHGDDFNVLFTDNMFHNNGLDVMPLDSGLAAITGDMSDMGQFKTPSIRNLIYTAPYMHDGRFETLEQVVEHYSAGLQPSPYIDPLMKNVDDGGVNLSSTEKEYLVFFLKSLSDESFITNPDFQE
ncbi:MAG: cytochrome-c peroxidase [Crocinitomicaceae bacterium]